MLLRDHDICRESSAELWINKKSQLQAYITRGVAMQRETMKKAWISKILWTTLHAHCLGYLSATFLFTFTGWFMIQHICIFYDSGCLCFIFIHMKWIQNLWFPKMRLSCVYMLKKLNVEFWTLPWLHWVWRLFQQIMKSSSLHSTTKTENFPLDTLYKFRSENFLSNLCWYRE